MKPLGELTRSMLPGNGYWVLLVGGAAQNRGKRLVGVSRGGQQGSWTGRDTVARHRIAYVAGCNSSIRDARGYSVRWLNTAVGNAADLQCGNPMVSVSRHEVSTGTGSGRRHGNKISICTIVPRPHWGQRRRLRPVNWAYYSRKSAGRGSRSEQGATRD